MSDVAPKKSLFNRPAWAAKHTSSNTKENAIFGRHQVFDEVLEQKRLRREAQAKERSQREKENLVQRKPADEPERKKRRISKNTLDDDSGSESERSRTSSHSRTSMQDEKQEDEDYRMTRSTPQKDKKLLNGLQGSQTRAPVSPSAAQKPVVIDLEDADSDDESLDAQQGGKTGRLLKPAPLGKAAESKKNIPQSKTEVDSEDSEEDEYLRALKRKARENRSKRLDLNQHKPSTSFSPASDGRSPSVDNAHPRSAHLTPSTSNNPSDPFADNKVSVEDDPEVGILIKSAIPNSKPLIVNRRASQPMQQVKDFWCTRQNFDPSLSAKVFFTWRGTKLFNSSTMKTVLRQLKKERGFDPEAGDDPSQGRITVEAMTEEIYQERLQAKERKLAAETNGEDDSKTEAASPPATDRPKKDGIVIKLTSQDLDPMPLRVRPNTSIKKIMMAFQQQRGIDKEKTCWLVFDGEKLEKEISVVDAGFEDGDEIEVYPR